MSKLRGLLKPLALAPAGVTLALLLAACSSGSHDTIAATDPATVVATLVSPSPTAGLSTPTSVADATTTPTATTSQEETPRASDPLASRLADEAMAFLTLFTEDLSPRASGTEQERDAAEFLAGRFESLGYEARLQPFTVDLTESSVVTGPDEKKLDSFHLTRSATGTAFGILVNVGKAFSEDIPAEGLTGKIALIQRGDITFEEKVSRVADAGAVAALVYNNRDSLFRGTLSSDAKIPVVAISREDGERLLLSMAPGDVRATVSVTFESHDTQNVIAEKPGTADDGGVVVLGGHYDTVPDVPGADDNGSGIASLMTIAQEIAGNSYPFTLRFIAFGSEELGLRGSRFYVDGLTEEGLTDIVAMLNFDALAHGGAQGAFGDFGLVGRVSESAQARGIDIKRSLTIGGGNSDHASFQQAGVPVVFFFDDDFSRIHTPDDRLDLVPPQHMGNVAAVAIDLLESLARG